MDDQYSVGDFCYYLSINNKVLLCEIKSVYQDEKELTYQVQDQINYRFATVEHRFCADTEKELKGRKRNE